MAGTLEIKKLIDQSIKKGDKVKLIDGTCLSLLSNTDKDYFIVCSYPELTGSEDILKDIECTVIEIGIDNMIYPFNFAGVAYLQDIIIQVGEAKFRTASNLVTKATS